MKHFWLIILTAVCMAISLPSMSQDETNNVQLASKYYQNGEYEKALTIYQDLYAQTEYKSYRDMYLSCLTLLKQFDAAEKFLKKEAKKKKNDFYILIDLGMVYYNLNRTSESEEQFAKAKEIALANESSVANAASAFQMYRQFQHAIDIYERAEKKFPNKKYGLEIGNIYSVEKNYEQMMEHYLDYLNGETLATIESRLSYVLANDSEDKAEQIIEKALIAQAQKKPNSASLNSLTIWLYTQTGRNEMALNQLIAYNKRAAQSNDKEIVEFGNEMAEIGEYETSIRAFNYLVKRKTRSVLHNEAYIGLLNVSYKKAVSKLNPDINELKALDSTINLALKDVAIAKAYDIKITSAQLKAFYLNKCDEAIEVINEAIASNYYKNKKDVTEHFSFEGRIVFCIESFLKQEPSRLIVEALESTKLYAIPYDELHTLIVRNQEMEMLYRKILEHVAISSQEHADSQRFENAAERYERLLHEKPEIILRAPMVHIASFLQMTPETLSRVRGAASAGTAKNNPPRDQNDAWWTHTD